MKKLLILVLALVLSACSALSPVSPTPAPTQTPLIQLATVLVPITNTPEPTIPPTATQVPPSPTPQVVVVTATGGAPATEPAGSGPATATATLPSDAGGLSKAGVVLFSNMTRSGSYFNFRCPPQELTFNVTTTNVYVVEVDMYYRMEDLTTQPTSISGWKGLGKMNGDKKGNYTITISTLQLSPDLRSVDKAWFDYQFVGIAKDGNSVGNSGKISQQILYLKNCP